MSTIKILQSEVVVCEGKGTILDRALEQGVDFPHQCRSGECGRCKSRLYRGQVRQLPCLDIALNPEERQSNLILACRSIATTDIELAWLDATEESTSETDSFDVVVSNIEYTDRVTLLSLQQSCNEPAFKYKAGQYVNFKIPGLPCRPYSMASPPGSGDLRFHIEKKAGGSMSNYIYSELRVGDQFKVEGPLGDAYLRINETGPLLAIGAGTGLAPVLAIVESSLMQSPERNVSLIYTEKLASHYYLTEQLAVLARTHPRLSLQLLTSRSNNSNHLQQGIFPEFLRELPISFPEASVYIAGSPTMVQTAATFAAQNGSRSQLIRADAFTRAPAPSPRKPSLLSRVTRRYNQLRGRGCHQQAPG